MTDDPNSIPARVARGADYGFGPGPSRSVLGRLAVQNPGLVQQLLEAVERAVRLTAHKPGCACSCGAAEGFAEARAEIYRLWRRMRP